GSGSLPRAPAGAPADRNHPGAGPRAKPRRPRMAAVSVLSRGVTPDPRLWLRLHLSAHGRQRSNEGQHQDQREHDRAQEGIGGRYGVSAHRGLLSCGTRWLTCTLLVGGSGPKASGEEIALFSPAHRSQPRPVPGAALAGNGALVVRYPAAASRVSV